ncbi:beta-alanine-activating enzyme isoform X3 [Anopheles arabiensis]|uniref:beta-alanine-activating enzyme isoform X3 n=1 Tax=Anopheles arabiensis TaxID=7173 RepID=UPI001AACCACF|nr:beta-alanine-activating enzyme isoform X3 [Anopheles arabiensis]
MELLDRKVFQTFSQNIAIKYYTCKETAFEATYDQLWQNMLKIAGVLKEQNLEGKIVGVQLFHCPALIAVIGGIIISGNTFYCIDKSWDEQLSPDHDICAAYFLQDYEFNSTHDGLQMLVGIRIFTMPLTFSLSVTSTESYRDVAFCIRTSGSTGPPKTVLVPSTCIMPNVLSLHNRFGLSDRDVIFVCSPPTFDPFVLDIVMGLRVGATLVMVDNSIRLSPKRLLGVLFPGITFMQMTPSMFTRWSKTDMLDIIFGPQTTLRTLVLGGERFPVLPRAADCRGNRSGTLRWKIRIGTKPILCQPIVLGGDGAEFVLVATLDGTIASISIATGCLAWKRTTQRSVPIFSTPTFLPEYNKIACCSVDGTLGIYETKQGTELTIHSLPGNVFSSLVMLKYPLDRVDFIVGCYDRHVHCVEYLPTNSNTLITKWKIEVQSQIYATPLLVEGYLVVCTTSGWINLIDTRDSSDAKNSIISSMKLNGELFASPVGYGKKVFVGCRDNFLYEILLNI